VTAVTPNAVYDVRWHESPADLFAWLSKATPKFLAKKLVAGAPEAVVGR